MQELCIQMMEQIKKLAEFAVKHGIKHITIRYSGHGKEHHSCFLCVKPDCQKLVKEDYEIELTEIKKILLDAGFTGILHI